MMASDVLKRFRNKSYAIIDEKYVRAISRGTRKK